MESSGLFNVLDFWGLFGDLNIFGSSPLEIPARKVIINKCSITKTIIKQCSPFGGIGNYTHTIGAKVQEEIPLSLPPTLIFLTTCFLPIVGWSRTLNAKGKERRVRKEMHSLVMQQRYRSS